MNNRQRVNAILHYQPYDRMPVVAFGYWEETVDKWAEDGYITRDEAMGYRRYGDSSPADRSIMDKRPRGSGPGRWGPDTSGG